MKINIDISEKYTGTEIIVRAHELTPELDQLISSLRLSGQQLGVQRGDETFMVTLADVVYIEAVDRKTFVYTRSDCFEIRYRLYELEEKLSASGFLRISKSSLVNIKQIRSIKSEINRRLRLTLETGEQIIVSRQYADELKQRLGVK